EGLPHPEWPPALTCLIAAARAWVDRCNRNDNALVQRLLHPALLSRMGRRVLRYRYIGDYRYAHKMGWLDVLADHSEVTVAFHRLCGIPAVYVPQGTSPEWWKEMNLERDIDVLWMGQRRNRRRRAVLVHVCRTLRKQGLNVYVADGIENPLIFGEKRTEILNRTRITLNIPTTWYHDCFIARFHMVAGNRCLVVSEPFLMHSAEYQPGVHYVQVETSHLVDTVMYYLEHEEERAAIAENAFQLVTTRLTLRNSVEKLLQIAEEHMRG
ncbi:MAG: glycosyltransferase family protein, partial [Anaerolineae bacterium]